MSSQINKTIVRKIDNVSIKVKIMFVFIGLILFPFSVASYFIYNSNIARIQQQTLYTSNQVFDQTIALIEYKIKSVMDTSNLVVLDQEVIPNINSRINIPSEQSLQQQYDGYRKLKSFISSLLNNNDIYKITLFVDDNFVYSNGDTEILGMKQLIQESYYPDLIKSSERLIWIATWPDPGKGKDYSISAFREIRDLKSLRDTIGWVKIDLKVDAITEIISKSLSTNNTESIIINSRNELISFASNKNEIGIWGQKTYNQGKNNNTNGFPDWEVKYYGVDKEQFLAKSMELTNTDWRFQVMIPYCDIVDSAKKSKNEMIIVILSTSFVGLILTYIFSSAFSKKIRMFVKDMKKAEVGEFDIETSYCSNDEIGQLRRNFNTMLTKIDMLIDEKYKLGKEKKNAELKALQAQINPHFLYNILEMINSISIEKNVPEISDIVQSLAKYYRLCLSRGEDIVKLKDEIEHIRTYIKIQNKRFMNAVDFEIEVNEELLQISIPKLTLQPLIENSINHGIMKKEGKQGKISVRIEKAEETLIIEIKDDGTGMSQEKLNNILVPKKSSSESYGVVNVNERLKLYYGENFGLSYQSRQGFGTSVKIKINAEKINEK